MIDGLQLSIPQRMILIRVTLLVSLITSVFLSLNLWGGYRSFPYAPLLDQPFINAPYDLLLSCCAIFCWVCALFLLRQRMFIGLAVVFSVVLVMHDVNRLQPWFYIYSSMLAVFIFYNGRVDDPNKFTSVFIILQLIFASVYFYCGISQLNDNFIQSTYGDLIEPLRNLMSGRQFLFFKKMGVLAPYLLMFIGVGFTISPLRYLAITLAVSMHLALFIFLFPSEKNTNYALWLSNLTFVFLLAFLFSGKTKQRYFSPTFLFKKPLFYIVTLLFIIMPAFNVVNMWPDYLSSNFKSGNNSTAIIKLSEAARNKLPMYQRYFCVPVEGGYSFNFNAWCGHELHSGCYPDDRVFNSIYEQLRQLTGSDVKDLQLMLQPKAKFLRKP